MKPLAIVGMACRFPQGLNDIQSLWNALEEKFSAINTVPTDRWSVERYFSANPISKGKSYITRGGFLDQDISQFDADFFGISPRDAENMDPQQRILLEIVWEAFENSGLSLPQLAGRDVGVYVGGFMLDHMITQMTPSNRSAINQHTAAGMMMTMLSNRISHTFDLRGPSLSIDTACSSSLVAFHYACQDLWSGSSEMAVVGGANIMTRPEYPMGMCKGHFLAHDGECKSFDERGDGYGRGEGAGVVLLKRLEDAVANGDPILATVLGTGCNQDGHTAGISMPNGESQHALIERVCERYSIDPATVQYVECHGTGTAIGDPTETAAIASTYGRARSADSPVIVGSIKSNIGHLEAAAGVAGVIKATLTLLHQRATPVANLQHINPKIKTGEWNLRIADDILPLTFGPSQELRVAVNSFGYGGTNAHAILQAAPPIDTFKPADVTRSPDFQVAEDQPFWLPLSTRSQSALADQAAQLADHLELGTDINDTIYTLAQRRAHLTHRAVVQGTSREELISGLRDLANGVDNDRVVQGITPFDGRPRPVIVFTGMGPQSWSMGQELYRVHSVYRSAVSEADAVFQQVSGFSILKEMLRDESTSRITQTEFAQPANFLLQIGLWSAMKHAGIVPGAFVGHSVGELSSAYFSGILSLKEAMTVCYHRSQLQSECKGSGAMLAAALSKTEALDLIAPHAEKVAIAAVNGPNNVTLAGHTEDIEALSNKLTAENVFNKRLEVEVPYHSPLMDPILSRLRSALAELNPRHPAIPVYSTVTGKLVEDLAYGSDYWPRNVRDSVEFATAINSLLDDGFTTFVEVGPHPVLATSIRDCIKASGKEGRDIFTLRRQQPETLSLERGMMRIFAEGCEIDWKSKAPAGRLIPLPAYPWQRSTYWMENDRARQDRIAPVVHPILGQQEAPATPAYRNDFDHQVVEYLRDHVVEGIPILPAAAYVESLLELANIKHPDSTGHVVRDFAIHAPMIITPDRGLDCVTSFEAQAGRVTIRGLENGRLGDGQTHVTAKIVSIKHLERPAKNLAELTQNHPMNHNIEAFYASLVKLGLMYGPAFRAIASMGVASSGASVLAEIVLPDELQRDLHKYRLHPVLLDCCFQSLMALLADNSSTFLPTGFRELVVYQSQSPSRLWCLGERTRQTENEIICDLHLMDDNGNAIATLRGMRSTKAGTRPRTDRFGDPVKRQILEYQWTYGNTPTEPKRLGHWLVVACDNEEFNNQLSQQMEWYGATIRATIQFGETYSRHGRSITLATGSIEDASRALEQIGELSGIAILNGLRSGTQTPEDPTGALALTNLATIARALAGRSYDRPPRCYVVTQGAHRVSELDQKIEPAQTALNGFARVAFNELEGYRFSTIDLPTNCSESHLNDLVLELLCDDDHDEVAIRDQSRLVSELAESDLLDKDVVQSRYLDNTLTIAIRSPQPDQNCIGTARAIETPLARVGHQDVVLRIEHTVVPPELLNDSSAVHLNQDFIEVVGIVESTGSDVTDIRPGQRVCGFIPADIANRRVINRKQLFASILDSAIDSQSAVASIGVLSRAQAAVSRLPCIPATALVEYDAIGARIAAKLASQGTRIAVLLNPDTDSNVIPTCFTTYSKCPAGIAEACQKLTGGHGFSLVSVGAQEWQRSFNFDVLAPSGWVIDHDDLPSPIELPSAAAGLSRTALSILVCSPQAFNDAIASAVDELGSGSVAPEPALDISVSDLTWKKLPLSQTNARVTLCFPEETGELPVVRFDRELKIRNDATYLVTGGFGGFGRKTIEWLVTHGARHIVLTGRTGVDTDERMAFVTQLKNSGVDVLAAACDTGDRVSLAELFRKISHEMPPLRGVFHSGAVIQDQPIAELELDVLAAVMSSKALGAWNLHELTRVLDLDYFVLYSSVANLVGNSRQSAYSAANGFLNGLAHYRQLLGLPATSVNWGAISDVGVVARDEKLEQFLRYTGLRGLTSSEGLGLLEQALARQVPQFGVTLITSWADWARFETRGAKSPRFASLISKDRPVSDSGIKDALVEELQKLSHPDQVDLLATLMVEIIAAVLKSDPANIPLDRSISQLGVDSLMATEIQATLAGKLGLSISVLELIGDSTARSLATKSIQSLLEPSATSPSQSLA